MAGLPILATAQPEYVNIVERYHIGICVNPDKKSAYKEGLTKILENYAQFETKNEFAKNEFLNSKNEISLFKSEFRIQKTNFLFKR